MLKGTRGIFPVLLLMALLLTGCTAAGELKKPEIPMASRILDVHGEVIATLAEENRQEIPLEEIPLSLQQAIVAIEDYRFYRHHGIDPVAIARAAFRNLRAGRIVEGGSTITQQTVKNLYLTREKTFGRKVREALLTIQMERRYTKKEILELYLNQIYFGQGAYGVEVAANTYFGKHARDLTLAESAMLAGIPRRPNYYSPLVNPEAAKKRQAVVLNRMADLKMISREEAEKAKKEPLRYAAIEDKKLQAPYFVHEVIRYITEKYENGASLLYRGGLTVKTTLDMKMQRAAEKAFQEGLAGTNQDLDGALVALDPQTGEIRAMVGGRDFSRSKFNRAVQARRQPGSAFKPFLYTAAIDAGDSPSRTIMCEYIAFPGQGGEPYTPADYGTESYHWRPFTLREALVASDNVVAVRLNSELGPATLAAYAARMGIESPLKKYLSLALGTSEVTPLEMARAYSTLANGGELVKPYFIAGISDRNGHPLEENRPQLKRVLDPKTAYIVTDMMRGVLQPGGTAGSVAGIINRPAAGKTGTTQNYKDAWFVGYTPELAAAIYIGYDNPVKSVGRTGGGIAAPIWAKFVAQALKAVEPRDFPIPPGITRVEICAETGFLATPYCPQKAWQGYVSSAAPDQPCPLHQGTPSPWPEPGQEPTLDEKTAPQEQGSWRFRPGLGPKGRKFWEDLLPNIR